LLTRPVPPFPSPLHCYPPHRPAHSPLPCLSSAQAAAPSFRTQKPSTNQPRTRFPFFPLAAHPFAPQQLPQPKHSRLSLHTVATSSSSLSPVLILFLPSRRSRPHITQNTTATTTPHPIFFSLTPIAPSPSSPESPSLSSSPICLHQATQQQQQESRSQPPPTEEPSGGRQQQHPQTPSRSPSPQTHGSRFSQQVFPSSAAEQPQQRQQQPQPRQILLLQPAFNRAHRPATSSSSRSPSPPVDNLQRSLLPVHRSRREEDEP